ncbi:YadA-like family protein, partial [Escherichia coli]|nr:YadA-like family protein [Escherichia coli]EIK2434474.1 YadA-like family protein [Escherichia coli]HDD8993188.1 YadA-like family protein [Escherichia coli]
QIKNVENGIDDYDAVNVSQLKAVSNSASEAISIVNNANTSINQAVNIANSLNDTVSKGINIGADNGPVVKRELGDTVTVTGDSNIRTKTTSTGVKVALNQNINLGENGSVNTGNTTVNSHGVIINEGPSMTRSGFNAANNRITNVAPGINNTDAVNVGQLNNVVSNVGKSIQNLNNRINHVEKNANAGIAEAMATAGLPQAYLPGKSMMAIGGGSYSGETGYAIGYSTISDNGRWMFKGTGSGNSRGNYGGTLGVGYQW